MLRAEGRQQGHPVSTEGPGPISSGHSEWEIMCWLLSLLDRNEPYVIRPAHNHCRLSPSGFIDPDDKMWETGPLRSKSQSQDFIKQRWEQLANKRRQKKSVPDACGESIRVTLVNKRRLYYLYSVCKMTLTKCTSSLI